MRLPITRFLILSELILCALAGVTPLAWAESPTGAPNFNGLIVDGNDNVGQPRDHISPEAEKLMWEDIRRNIAALKEQDLLATPDAAQTLSIVQAVTYSFPLRMAPSRSDYAGFRVSAFVDNNPAVGQVLDYNGGARTYDGHHGTDYALWPFSWNKVDAADVQVIAAAAGTIVSKNNTDSTDHNPCDSGSSSDTWNYVALTHADGRMTIYGHMGYNSLTPKGVGQTVAQGEYLGTVASSGSASGPHLHFEVRYGTYSNNEWIDPYSGPSSHADSLWTSQRPYLDSAINKLATQSAQPVEANCKPTVTNLQDTFTTPARIHFYAYYRDYQGVLPTQGTIYRPDGSVFQSWSYTDGNAFSSATNRSWAFDFSSQDPAGIWRFEAAYNGQTYATLFNVNTSRLLNIATRGKVETVDNVMIAGFIIQGSTAKKVLIRARGPSLAVAPFNVPGTLADPFLTLYSGATPIDSNDDFASHPNAASIPADWVPTNAKESAIVATLNPGAYTAIVNGVGGTSGVAIVEVFEIDHPETPLSNIATRGPVYTGDNVMIAGLIIQGDTPKTVLITARGPSMAVPPFNVPGTLPDPTLTLYSGQTVIASNDNWGSAANAVQIQSAVGAPTNNLESAILITLQPGAYTAIVSGANGGTGLGIVEVFAQ
jgi:murein DD-endopeptidase MepM/ murein hydrolase activator NlpD